MSKFKEAREGINRMAEERMTICRSCPHFNDMGLCKKCKCIMRLKSKIPNAKCPVGKW